MAQHAVSQHTATRHDAVCHEHTYTAQPPYNATQQRNNNMYRDETHTQTPHNTDHNNTTRHNKTPQRTRYHKNAGEPRQTTPHDITQRSYMAP